MSENDQPGMASRESWKQTAVHRASRYSCGKCGKQFAMPHDVYDHLDAEHPKPEKDKRNKKR